MKKYSRPRAELIAFNHEKILSDDSGTCRCYLDIGVKFDYNAAGSPCWTDSEDASAYDVHDAPL